MNHNATQTNDQMPHERVRMTVPQAASFLGISAEAVRARIHRGTLKHTKDEGTVYVLLPREDGRHNATQPHNDAERTDHHDDARTHHDSVITSEIVRRLEDHNADLRDQVQQLRRELEVRNDELRRKDHLLAATLERIPAIDPPEETSREASERPQKPADSEGDTEEPAENTGQPQASWWKRLLTG